jgi:anti-sigma factor RsiW
MHMCDSKELLVGFLYDEIDPVSKRTFERHLATCSDCRDELAELGATREQIALWAPPDADLGFRIVRGANTPASARARFPFFSFSPAWGLAAAALIVLAIGAAIANLDVRYGNEGLVVRTGWNHTTDAQAGVTPVDWKAQAQELDRRLRDLEQSASARAVVQTASASDQSDAELLQRVRDIVGQSETRQQRAVATRLTELMREVDAQRRLDLATIDQGMTRLQNLSSLTKESVQRLSARALVKTAYDTK